MGDGRLIWIDWEGRWRPRQDVIRDLHRGGMSVGDIGRRLDIRYQVVRQTILGDPNARSPQPLEPRLIDVDSNPVDAVLLGCVKTKDVRPRPAKDLYTSELFLAIPNGDRRGITERWKDVAKALHDQGKLTKPGFGRSGWVDFRTLVDYRNGLVHAAASRPVDVQKPSNVDPPTPPVHVLDGLTPGWATNTVGLEIRELHRLAGIAPPAWFVAV